MLRILLAVLPAALTAALVSSGAREPLVALAAIPALLWAPGAGFARRTGRDGLERALDAVWISVALAVPAVLLGAYSGLGGPGALAASATFAALGQALRPRAPVPVLGRWRLGALGVAVVVAVVAVSWRDTIRRPLERHWWFAPAETEGWAGAPPRPGLGWQKVTRFGDAYRLEARDRDPWLLGPMQAPVVIALRGPTGATMEARGEVAQVRADPTESAEEGPVPRYLDRGVTALWLAEPLGTGERLPIRLSHPAASDVYVIPSADALWDLHGDGELRFVHYYQLLNMVEQVRWARELFRDRRVTDVQPPLGAYVAATPLALTDGDLPTQNVLTLGVLALVGLCGVAAVRAWAPLAPPLAGLLPAAAVAEHAKLVYEPGSAGMPDGLYAAALLAALASLARPGPRFGVMGLLAQLLRYPGAIVAAIAAGIAGQWARAGRMLAVVLGVAAAFAVGGAATGSLPGWLDTVWWETGPEHWHGETDPAVLLPRAPRFFATWLGYAGGLPLLAAVRWPPGTRVALGTALVYAAILATVDHHPSHYFLPLLHLSAVAAACTAATFRAPLLRHGLPLLGLAGLAWAALRVPVTG